MSTTVSRRSFLFLAGGASVGLVLGCRMPANAAQGGGSAFAPNVFIAIAPDGVITLTLPKPDMGQGSRTAVAMIFAEELGVELSSINFVQALADQAYGGQSVGGSTTIRGSYGRFKAAGATVATLLRQAGASKLGVGADECELDGGFVVAKGSGKKIKLGEAAVAAAGLPIPDASQVKARPKSEHRLIGKPTRRIDNHDVVTGKAKYGLDARVEGMRFAVIARTPFFGASVGSFDDSGCKAVPGFETAVRVGSGVAVVADSTWSALKAREALKVVWEGSPSISDAELKKRFKEAVQAFPAEAPSAVTATYSLPYLSHMPMEPMNCTVNLKGDSAEMWVPTQGPEGCLNSATRILGLPAEKVRVNITLVGGGFGRRLSPDYAAEACQIAKQVGGCVQLLWTRDDDTRHDNYRPANYHAFAGSVGADGYPETMYHQAFQAGGGGGNRWGNLRSSYELKGGSLSGGVASPVPTGAWRSVENTFLCFVTECFFDELCAAGKVDPVQARLRLLRNDRLKATLEKARELAEWDKPLPKGWGRGVACFGGYDSYITQIAEVEVKGDEFKVRRVVAVVDCGMAVNPLGVKAQIEGATTDAVSTTLFASITLKEGGVLQKSFDDFGWARMADAPKVEVHILETSDRPGGIGEVGYPAAGPAIANAIFAATGKRYRDLPIVGV